ncbi:MAG: hypothetical protein IT359_03155 [Gemmatimonadaceae bacterium]|nr:hypothetical protein [Gemmatimonadaceae bacterium]
MNVGDGLRKAAAGAAGVAMATAGLSSCKNGNGGGLGAVDPAPPPLQCNSVSGGQTMQATASLTPDSVIVEIRNVTPNGVWLTPRITAVSGGAIGRITTPPDGSAAPFVVAFPFGGASTLSITFTFEGALTSGGGESCTFRRNFIVTATRNSATVAQVTLDALPLPARQRAEIILAEQVGRRVVLRAQTPYRGAHLRTWDVSAGTLSDTTSDAVTWMLPDAPGIYAAELALDYGDDGMAFDALMLEVLPDEPA